MLITLHFWLLATQWTLHLDHSQPSKKDADPQPNGLAVLFKRDLGRRVGRGADVAPAGVEQYGELEAYRVVGIA